MWLINNGAFISTSIDGTNMDLNIKKTNISSIQEQGFIAGVNFSQANPSNRTNYAAIEIRTNDGSSYIIDLNQVSNQPTFTPDQPGLKLAVTTMLAW